MRRPLALLSWPRRTIEAAIGYLARMCYPTRPQERCRSGRTGRSRKPLCLHGHPGFESLSLRQQVCGCRQLVPRLTKNLMFPKMRRFRRAPEQCNAAINFNPSALSAPDSYVDRIRRPSRSNVAPFRFHLLDRTKPDSRSGGQAAPNMKLRKHLLSDNGKSSFRMRGMHKPGMSSFRGGAYAIKWTQWYGDF